MSHTPIESIVVRLKALPDPAADADVRDLRDFTKRRRFDDLRGVLDAAKVEAVGRLVTSLTVDDVLGFEDRAAKRQPAVPLKGPQRSLTQYWRFAAPTDEHDLEALVKKLNALDIVDTAYGDASGDRSTPSPPILAGAPPDPLVRSQYYLDPAPVGVDARFAWSRPDGGGASVGFVDLESGWLFSHEDLPPIATLDGVCRDIKHDMVHHGTSVLAIVAGRHGNGLGIAGIASHPRRVAVASHFRKALETDSHVTDTIASLLPHLEAGDVLLLEWQDFHGRPADVVPHIRDAIRVVSRLGAIVIECAGNGDAGKAGFNGYDLDKFDDLNREANGFEDSGAIMVGACHAALDPTGQAHDRWIHPSGVGMASNFGSRIDCHAWGEHVVTAGARRTAGPTHKDSYKGDFGGTSAAGAIIAGVAVVLQGMHIAQKKRPLSPIEMREVLAANGTPQGTAVKGHIGVMPDLKKAAAALGL
jgi:hypothetical protein